MLVSFFEKTEVLFFNWKGFFTATILPKSKYILGNEIIERLICWEINCVFLHTFN